MLLLSLVTNIIANTKPIVRLLDEIFCITFSSLDYATKGLTQKSIWITNILHFEVHADSDAGAKELRW